MAFVQTSMGIFVAVLLFLIILYFYKQIHMRQYRYMAGALVMSFIVILLSPRLLNINLGPLTEIIASGHLSLAFFILVIFAGVFKKNTLPRRALSLVRGELAVIGFIFLLPHAFTRLELALTGYNMSGLFAMITMLPLVVTTFMFIRKKMSPRAWKTLHRLSYLTYVLIYMHLAFDVSVNPNFQYVRLSPNAILYHVLLLSYIALRVVNVWLPKRQALAKA